MLRTKRRRRLSPGFSDMKKRCGNADAVTAVFKFALFSFSWLLRQ